MAVTDHVRCENCDVDLLRINGDQFLVDGLSAEGICPVCGYEGNETRTKFSTKELDQ